MSRSTRPIALFALVVAVFPCVASELPDRAVSLDLLALRTVLSQAPLRGPGESQGGGVEVDLPMLDGSVVRFEVVESPVMEPGLAARYPEIKTYAGRSRIEPSSSIRFDISPRGLHGIVFRGGESFYIRKLNAEDSLAHVVSRRSSDPPRSPSCSTRYEDVPVSPDLPESLNDGPDEATAGRLRIYRIAIAATEEFVAQSGGTKATAMAEITSSVNMANAVYERDLGMFFDLVDNNDQVVYLPGSADPFTSGDKDCADEPPVPCPPSEGRTGPLHCLQAESQCTLDTVIGSANYDIGMVFDQGIGGNAGGGACNTNTKGWAMSDSQSDIFMHELGHMFGAPHTFNDNMNGNCADVNQYQAADAYEVGSGSTIMSYAGLCDSGNIQLDDDLFFHSGSYDRIRNYAHLGFGASCSDTATRGNWGPIIRSTPVHRTIPARTPFKLQVDAYDPNPSDSLTYSWEQMDLGAASPPYSDDGARPIFRAYAPVSDSWRYFPSWTYILGNSNVPPATLPCGAGQCLVGETLPTTSRTMAFDVMIRDGVDGVSKQRWTVTTDANSGPFRVTSQNTADVWTIHALRTVTWDVANSNQPPVSCPNVRILLGSSDDDFNIVLAANTPNDGAETVRVPDVLQLSWYRVMVECVNGAFFDISDGDVRISELVVLNTNDSGSFSLRQAILDLNTMPNNTSYEMRFAISPTGQAHTIRPSTPLPPIVVDAYINGLSQGGEEYNGVPLIEIDGSLIAAPIPPNPPADGLVMQSSNGWVAGVVVNNFLGNGIVLRGGGYISVLSCYSGTDLTGTIARPNGMSGLLLDGAFLGGADRSVFSGNDVGVTIQGAGAWGNGITRCRIGTNAEGTARLPNKNDGIRIIGSRDNFIGTETAGYGNVIAGNGTLSGNSMLTAADGIEISGTGATGNRILGNLIGLAADGVTALDNTGHGISIQNAASTQIGGGFIDHRNVIGDRGVINFTLSDGIRITGPAAVSTVIQGNYIGTDKNGLIDLGMRGSGIYLDDCGDTQIGGAVVGAGNLITGSPSGAQITINTAPGARSTIWGNRIGTNAAGTASLGLAPMGIQVLNGGHTIGGPNAGEGNVISGNRVGVFLDEIAASNNTLQGNLIGTDPSGTLDVGNNAWGIQVERSTHNAIGGSTPGAGNLISGNNAGAISISGSIGSLAPGNVISGNKIGTDISGSFAIGNGAGISLSEVHDCTIGGTQPGAGNLISGNAVGAGYGIEIVNSVNTTSDQILGNSIGTNLAGTAPIPNSSAGIQIATAGTIAIGGSGTGAGNLISGNAQYGIVFNSGAGSLQVRGNRIGTDASGTLALGNQQSGIALFGGQAHVIGGIAAGEGNTIAFNAPPGSGTNYAGVRSTAGTLATIRGNAMHSNVGLGIDVTGLGLTANDNCDVDTSFSDAQNYPVISAAEVTGAITKVVGTLNSNASSSFTLDFYHSPSCDSLGNGEGRSYFGSTTVTTDAGCNGSFSVKLPMPASGVVTATATSPTGMTSEFSSCRVVVPGPIGEATQLRWAPGSKDNLLWNAASGATSYKLLRGTTNQLPNLLSTALDSCQRLTTTNLSSGPVLTELPIGEPDRAYWYLVVGTNGSDDGSPGNASSGPRLADPNGSCP